MRKWKTALSLSLALALSLTLAVPAFAAESNWKVEVPGKSNTEVFVGEKTFTVRDWVISGTYEDEYYSGDSGVIWSKTDSHKYTAENVYVLSKGDEVVFTKGGESFEALYMTGWSDPDGDGVYDMRIADLYAEVTDPVEFSAFLPINTAGPVRSLDARIQMFFYMPSAMYFEISGITPGEYGYWDAVGTGGVSTVTELKMAPDFLLDVYGPNTLVSFTEWNGDEYCDVCTILVEGDATQPTQPSTPSEPTTPTQPTTPVVPADGAYKVSTSVGNGLNVRTGPGTNYKKVGAALREGTVIEVVEIQGQWGKLANDAGWVFMPGTKAVSEPAAPVTPAEPEQPAVELPVTLQVSTSAGKGLNVRIGPGTNYKLASAALREGTVIEVVEIDGQWGKLANDAGWVFLPGTKAVKG